MPTKHRRNRFVSAAKLAALLDKAEASEQDVAMAAGVSEITVQRMLDPGEGSSRSHDVCAKVAKALGVSVDDFSTVAPRTPRKPATAPSGWTVMVGSDGTVTRVTVVSITPDGYLTAKISGEE